MASATRSEDHDALPSDPGPGIVHIGQGLSHGRRMAAARRASASPHKTPRLDRGRDGPAMVESPHPHGDADVAARGGPASITAGRMVERNPAAAPHSASG